MGAHRLDLRVRYAESDQMGFAHHGAYVIWLETARIELMRAQGESYRELEASGVLMPVVECRLRYRRPLRFDDLVVLETTVAISGPSRLTFTTRVRHGETLCAEGEVTIATVDRAGKPMRLPERVARLLGGTVIWHNARNGQWAAVLHFDRPQLARIPLLALPSLQSTLVAGRL